MGSCQNNPPSFELVISNLSNPYSTHCHELRFPCYLNRVRGQLEYSSKWRPQSQEYRLNQTEDGAIVLQSTKKDDTPIWREVDSSVVLRNNDCFLMGEVVMEVVKICLSYKQISDSFYSNSRVLFGGQKSRYTFTMIPQEESQDDDKKDICRICHSSENDKKDPLLSFCRCAGSVGYTHYSCIRKWMKSRVKEEVTSYCEYYEYSNICDLCKTELADYVVQEGKEWQLFTDKVLHPPYAIMATVRNNVVSKYVLSLREGKSLPMGSGQRGLVISHPSVQQYHARLVFCDQLLQLEAVENTFLQLKDQIQVHNGEQLKMLIHDQTLIIKSKDHGSNWLDQTTLHPYKLQYLTACHST